MRKNVFTICLILVQSIISIGVIGAMTIHSVKGYEIRTENIALLTPSSKSLMAVTNELFMIHFKQDVSINLNESIFIYNSNGTLFEEINLNLEKVIDLQTKRIMFEASKDLELDSNYYINFSEKVFSDSTSIDDDTTWSFTCGLKLKEIQLYSPAINDSFRLLIGLPENYSNDINTSYHAVYITDGGFFNHGQYSEIANAGALNKADDYILVGIAYPKKYTIDDVRQFRRRDLASSPQNLLNFLNDSIIPFIDSKYRTKPKENTLIGNSNGGYFAAYVLTSYRENINFQFKNIFAVAQLNAFTAPEISMYEAINDLPVNFYLAVGGADNSSRLSAFNNLKDNLICRQYSSFGFEFKVYDGMPHGEISSTAAFYDAFRLTEFTKLWPCALPLDNPTNTFDLTDNNSPDVSVYPNPVSTILHINLSDDVLQDMHVYLYNSMGKLIFNNTLTNTNYSLDFNSFPACIYFISIVSADYRVAEKTIIKY